MMLDKFSTQHLTHRAGWRWLLLALLAFMVVVSPQLLSGGLTTRATLASLTPAGPQMSASPADAFGKMPLYFVENHGQLDERVRYYLQGRDKTIYFSDDGLTFVLNGPAESTSRWTLKLDFVGASVQPSGQAPTGAVFSYFNGPKVNWQTGLQSYGEVVYQDLWPGIDLVYGGTVSRMKYTFVVHPGADPNQIKLAWRGASEVRLNAAGELEVTTPAGGFTDERPIAWQEADGAPVAVAYQLGADAQGADPAAIAYGFAVGDYDRSQTLVIDPAVLVYSGFIGGSSSEIGNDIAVDSAGNAYIVGTVRSNETSFPVTVGPDLTYNLSTDAFVAKVNASGTALIYAGYIGGSDTDLGNDIAVDSAGNAYIIGETSSNEMSFPVTNGPDLTFNGGFVDAFVAKVNASGTGLDYAGYIGGASGDVGSGIAVDSAGNAYVTGATASDETSFPVTVGPDLTYNGGTIFQDEDAFVAKVNASGTALVYAGYIGGSTTDRGFGIALDNAGNAYVTGDTDSDETSFPVAVGPDLTFNNPGILTWYDAFVAKVNASGTALEYAGYIGGNSIENVSSIAVDVAGNAYITGRTGSTESSFPVTGGGDLTHNGSFYDAFVAKVNASGTVLDYAGYIGGGQRDEANDIAVDSVGNAYIIGTTYSDETTFPVTNGPDLTFNGGPADAFVAKLDASGAFVYNGYIGGSGDDEDNPDEGRGIAVDSAGNAYVTGRTPSNETSFPVTVGPDLTHNGSRDVFVAKISLISNSAPVAADDSYSTNEDAALTVAAPGVLSNDSDAETDPLSAVLVSGPSHGSLTLNLDGSFSYTPAADFSGSDSFTYLANDGQADSNVATVNLSVVSAADQIDQLGADVQALVDSAALSPADADKLFHDLDQAQKHLDKGQTQPTINMLEKFIKDVNKLIDKGDLASAQGQPLIDAANAVIDSLS